MISQLGKYIPFIFLTIAVFIFLDAFFSLSVIYTITNNQQVISLAYHHMYTKGARLVTQKELFSVEEATSAFSSNITHMYIIIILSAILNSILLTFAYIALMRELRQRSLLEQKKNDFISLASHELKTPITSMSVFTQLLAQKIPKDNRQVLYLLHKMENQVKEMINLINDLLDVTRIQLGKLDLHTEAIDFPEFIKETIEDIQPTTKRHTIFYTGPKNIFVIADKQRLWQVLANLLTNSIKYSPKKGRIQVSLEKKVTRAVLSIHDNGIGISKENQEHIFDRYFREATAHHENVSGLGLGLFLAKQIVQLHGGRIWVRSTIKKGATFFFTLPLAKKRKI